MFLKVSSLDQQHHNHLAIKNADSKAPTSSVLNQKLRAVGPSGLVYKGPLRM